MSCYLMEVKRSVADIYVVKMYVALRGVRKDMKLEPLFNNKNLKLTLSSIGPRTEVDRKQDTVKCLQKCS